MCQDNSLAIGGDSILDLTERAETLENSIGGLSAVSGGHLFDLTSGLRAQLDELDAQIESEALRLLEEHLVETESGMDNVLSTQDLEVIAGDASNSPELQAAAQYYFDNREARSAGCGG